ncbi:MAG: hypothetical protein BGO68_01195 [Candidatus Amoebophilus sp. 36-38]|nr:MAG: hypothetical protein BGO68_01195 [Candidatus Amoebophilus sp. 36-38]
MNCTFKKELKKGEKDKLITEQKELMVDFQKKFNLTSEQVESFKQAVERSKNEESVHALNGLITLMETLKEELESSNPADQQTNLDFVNATIHEYIPNFLTITDVKKAIQVIDIQIQIWKNVKEQVALKNYR